MVTKTTKPRTSPKSRRPFWRRWKRWQLIVAAVVALPVVVACGLLGYYYVRFSRIVDVRLHGEQARVFPHVYARPMEIRRGQAVTQAQLLDRLNDLG